VTLKESENHMDELQADAIAREITNAQLGAMQGQILGLNMALATLIRNIAPDVAAGTAKDLAVEMNTARALEALEGVSLIAGGVRDGTAEGYLELLRARAR
jgi:hypothetical protein